MARTTLVKTTAGGAYATDGVSLTVTAADVSNKNQFVASGKDLVIAYNSGGLAYTVTITSVADKFNRTGDIATDSIPAGEFHIYGPYEYHGWKQTDGNVYLEASNAAVKFGIITL